MTDMQLILSDILLPKDIAGSWLQGLSLPGLETLMQRSGRGQNETPVAPEFQRTSPDIRALLRHYAYPVSAQGAALAPLLMLADGLNPVSKSGMYYPRLTTPWRATMWFWGKHR